MNPIDKEIERALNTVTLSKDAKYRVKNKMQSAFARTHKHSHPHRRLSAAAVFSLTLVSLLVISAAAIGGLSLFNAIYGDNAATLTPSGITIGTSAKNDDVILTLHESVADDYATAYIFSVKGLNDIGKALVASNTLDPNAYQNAFHQTNAGEAFIKTNVSAGIETMTIERIPPEENLDCQLYELRQRNFNGEFLSFDIGLRNDGVTYDAVVNATYVIIPIESLREENCEYYALYIITPETQQLTLTVKGLDLPRPEATIYIPGVEIQINGYIQDYFLNEEGMSKIMSNYPISAILTPLGLYVNSERTRSMLMYQYAELVLTDGKEIELGQISNEKLSNIGWKPNYSATSYNGVIYLFNEIMDVSTVKSLLFYNDIEFPFDGGTPFVRSSGRFLEQVSPRALIYTIAEQIRDYVDELCPDTWTVNHPNGSYPYSGWTSVNYVDDESFSFKRQKQNREGDAYFTVSMCETTGGTLEDEARSWVEDMNVKRKSYGYENDLTFNVIASGTYDGTEVLVVECGETNPGLYKRCLFALYKGKLLTIAYDGYTGQPNDYAFDALLDLITF